MRVILILVALLMFSPVAQAVETASVMAKPSLQESNPVTSGAVMKKYHWDTSDGPAKIYVLEIDLANPYVHLDVIPGAGKLTQRLNVTAMARNTGAVAAINGDFYNTRAEFSPIGPMVSGGNWVTSPSKLEGIYALGITKDRQAYIEPFAFSGKVTAPGGSEYELAGLNKTFYWEEPYGDHSHVNKLHLYNDMWGGTTRGEDSYTIPTEMLVENGRVVRIVAGEYIESPVPEGMQILRGHGAAARFLTENFAPGDPVMISYSFQPDRNWSMVLGGHALLVDQGAAVEYTKDISALGGVRARTAAGISRDGKKVWLVGVEGRTANSKGLTLKNLSRFFVELDAFRAVNLDGGGSTTMAARPLGGWEAQRVFQPEQEHERLVVNGLGVYTSAPSGSLKGLVLQGNDLVLVNEKVSFSLRAYDNYYNPVDPGGLNVTWQAPEDMGTMEGNVFNARQAGQGMVAASAGTTSAMAPVKVIGRGDVAELLLTASGTVEVGKQIPLRVELKTISGKSRQVPASLVDWQFYGLKGEVSPEGNLLVHELEDRDARFVVARYQGFSAPLPVKLAGEQDPPVPPRVSMELTVGEKEILVNGSPQQMDVEPVIVDGRTMVPVRFISQAMNAPVLWDNDTKNATVVQKQRWLDLWLDENLMAVNGKNVELDVPPLLLEGRTMLPLSAVASAMGVEVEWEAETKKVFLN